MEQNCLQSANAWTATGPAPKNRTVKDFAERPEAYDIHPPKKRPSRTSRWYRFAEPPVQESTKRS